MTRFEKLRPHIEALFGKETAENIDWFVDIYSAAISRVDCEDCMVGDDNCTRRMGMTLFSECNTDEEIERWENETGNGKICEDILREWLSEEADE